MAEAKWHVAKPDKRVGKPEGRVGKPERRVGKPQRRVGKPQRRVGKLERRVGKPGSPCAAAVIRLMKPEGAVLMLFSSMPFPE